MQKGLSAEVIYSEFPEDTEVWAISIGERREGTNSLLVVPDQRDMQPVVQLFMKREDAEQYATLISEKSRHLKGKNLIAVPVNLHEIIRMLSSEEPPHPVTLNTPNGMYQFFQEQEKDSGS